LRIRVKKLRQEEREKSGGHSPRPPRHRGEREKGKSEGAAPTSRKKGLLKSGKKERGKSHTQSLGSKKKKREGTTAPCRGPAPVVGKRIKGSSTQHLGRVTDRGHRRERGRPLKGGFGKEGTFRLLCLCLAG